MVKAKFKDGKLHLFGFFPHYRRPLTEIVELRKNIHQQLLSDTSLPITENIHLSINAYNQGFDLPNIVQAICQALDGTTLGPDFAVLADDAQIVSLRARWVHQ